MKFDPESNIISWEISKGAISHAYEFGNFIIHVSKAGKPILIEILDGSKFVGKIDRINITKELGQIIPVN